MNYFYQLKKTQFLQASLDEVWDFIRDPSNLSKITPKQMDFKIQGENPKTMYPGMMIGYRVKPLLGIPIPWVTEITHIQDKKYFVDEQRLGPYKIWHHEHHLQAKNGGIEMYDIVSYCIGFSVLDPLLNHYIVEPQLQKIFDYREKVLNKLFAPLPKK